MHTKNTNRPHIIVSDLTLAYGSFVLMHDVSFKVNRGDIFIIMGGSGCGKSTLLKSMVGLKEPAKGRITFNGLSFWEVEETQRQALMQRSGILYQNGALWSSMTLLENVCLPLERYTDMPEKRIRDVGAFKLALVGLAGFEDYYPHEISGGMRKRAGLARAMAFDPEFLFFDEPGAGLDPISSSLQDELILELSRSLEATVIIVTHELASIFAIGSNAIFLDAEARTVTAWGSPQAMLAETKDATLKRFLTRGRPDQASDEERPANP